MKKLSIVFASLLAVLLTACKANMPVAQQSGKEDIAYLLLVSNGGTYNNKTVQVSVDGQTFDAVVVKQKTSNRRGTQYTAPTGSHQLTVTFNGQTIYNKKVFLSTQQVKRIELP